MKKRISALVAAAVLVGGCSGRQYTLPTPEFDRAKYDVLGSGSQTATGVMLFSFIPIGVNSKIERAIKRLMSEQGGDAVANITVRERWFWAYILNGYKVDVEATVLKVKPQPTPTIEIKKKQS